MSERLIEVSRYEYESKRVPGVTSFVEYRVAPAGRCRGFAIGDGNFSGCAYGDGAANGSLGDDVCPVCNNTGVAPPNANSA